MKLYDEMSCDEQQDYLEFAEAEYCPKCGGRQVIAVYDDAHKIHGGNIWGRTIVAFADCDRCRGTGRA